MLFRLGVFCYKAIVQHEAIVHKAIVHTYVWVK